MMKEKEIELLLATAKDEEILYGVVEVLQVAQVLLDPTKTSENRDFCSGLAINEVSHAVQVLRAFCKKRYGGKSITTL